MVACFFGTQKADKLVARGSAAAVGGRELEQTRGGEGSVFLVDDAVDDAHVDDL